MIINNMNIIMILLINEVPIWNFIPMYKKNLFGKL